MNFAVPTVVHGDVLRATRGMMRLVCAHIDAGSTTLAVDLSRVKQMQVLGSGEVGVWGSARPRWMSRSMLQDRASWGRTDLL